MSQHLRIKQAGFSNLTGSMGNIDFVDGLSVHAVSPGEAARLCATIRAEFEDGSNPSPAGILVAHANSQAEVVAPLATGDEIDAPLEVEEGATAPDLEPSLSDLSPPEWTQAELEAIADEKGIVGLREVAEPLGIKSNSISSLVTSILAHEAK